MAVRLSPPRCVFAFISFVSLCHQSLTCHLLHQVVDGNWGAHVAIQKKALKEMIYAAPNQCGFAGARLQVCGVSQWREDRFADRYTYV